MTVIAGTAKAGVTRGMASGERTRRNGTRASSDTSPVPDPVAGKVMEPEVRPRGRLWQAVRCVWQAVAPALAWAAAASAGQVRRPVSRSGAGSFAPDTGRHVVQLGQAQAAAPRGAHPSLLAVVLVGEVSQASAVDSGPVVPPFAT